MRFDLTVNIFANHAVNRRKILVFVGVRTRANTLIDDLTDHYLNVLDEPVAKISGQIFNAGYANSSLDDLANIARRTVEWEFPGDTAVIQKTPISESCSNQVNSQKIADVFGFRPLRTIKDSVRDLCRGFRAGRFPKSLDDRRYFNVAPMKAVQLVWCTLAKNTMTLATRSFARDCVVYRSQGCLVTAASRPGTKADSRRVALFTRQHTSRPARYRRYRRFL